MVLLSITETTGVFPPTVTAASACFYLVQITSEQLLLLSERRCQRKVMMEISKSVFQRSSSENSSFLFICLVRQRNYLKNIKHMGIFISNCTKLH